MKMVLERREWKWDLGRGSNQPPWGRREGRESEGVTTFAAIRACRGAREINLTITHANGFSGEIESNYHFGIATIRVITYDAVRATRFASTRARSSERSAMIPWRAEKGANGTHRTGRRASTKRAVHSRHGFGYSRVEYPRDSYPGRTPDEKLLETRSD